MRSSPNASRSYRTLVPATGRSARTLDHRPHDDKLKLAKDAFNHAAIGDGRVGEIDEVRGPNESEWLTVREHAELGTLVPQARRVSSRAVDDAESDMTPMIDIVFLLVIFFMVGTKFAEMERTIKLEVPRVKNIGALTAIPEKRIINVYRDGSLKDVDFQPITEDQITERIAGRALDPFAREVILRAHELR